MTRKFCDFCDEVIAEEDQVYSDGVTPSGLSISITPKPHLFFRRSVSTYAVVSISSKSGHTDVCKLCVAEALRELCALDSLQRPKPKSE